MIAAQRCLSVSSRQRTTNQVKISFLTLWLPLDSTRDRPSQPRRGVIRQRRRERAAVLEAGGCEAAVALCLLLRAWHAAQPPATNGASWRLPCCSLSLFWCIEHLIFILHAVEGRQEKPSWRYRPFLSALWVTARDRRIRKKWKTGWMILLNFSWHNCDKIALRLFSTFSEGVFQTRHLCHCQVNGRQKATAFNT